MGDKPKWSPPEVADPVYGAPSQAPPPPAAAVRAAADLPEFAPETSRGGAAKDHEDAFDSAIRMAFIGAGQAGGRLCQSFFDLGYRRVCAINTTDQDLAALTFDRKLVIGGRGRGGAGKDPIEGEAAAKESFEDIMDLMLRAWGEKVEFVWILVGSGGGSGTGSWPVLVDAAREYCKTTNIEKPLAQHIGVIMTLPKRSEGARVQANALLGAKQALGMLQSKRISSLILVDNAKIHELYPGLPVKKFWTTANQNFAAVFHTFNLLGALKSEYSTFDRADLRSIIRNGLMIFGMTKVDRWKNKEDISQAMRQNLKGTLLADGFDLTKANMAGAVVVAHDDVLQEIPMENIDYALFSMNRILGSEGVTLHSGIYEGTQPGMRVFTVISGLEAPAERLAEIDSLGR
jgi:cell division GTPase FtsZ